MSRCTSRNDSTADTATAWRPGKERRTRQAAFLALLAAIVTMLGLRIQGGHVRPRTIMAKVSSGADPSLQHAAAHLRQQRRSPSPILPLPGIVKDVVQPGGDPVFPDQCTGCPIQRRAFANAHLDLTSGKAAGKHRAAV